MIKRWGERGLTLVEILLALVIMALGIIGILALFPPAIQSSKEAMEETQAAITAESVAHGLINAIRFAQWDSGNQLYDCTLTQDLKTSSVAVKYNFSLPKLTEPGTVDGWLHHPDPSATPTTYVHGIPTTDPKTQPLFNLAGDDWVYSAVMNVRNTNDMSDPYLQFAFSFDVRKIHTLDYMLSPPYINPVTNGPYTLADLEPMSKLYEFRINVFRMKTDAATGGTTTTSGGTTVARLIATVTDRVAVK